MSIAFDASYYLLNNPDVAAAVVGGQFPDAYTHFVLHGAKELRNPNAQFNAAEYAGMYPDVANAVAAGHITSVWDHYVYFGIAENRAPSLALKDFDAASYLAIHTDVAAAVTAGAFKSAIDHYLTHGQAENRTWGENTQLTNGTDKLVANKFVAGLVYTPGGNDRINSLQDEDELTGIGTNPTLTATLGNANDNGGTTITPILKGIQTVNVAFSGSGTGLVTTLDLQDATGLTGAVNVTRISLDVGPVGITNMASIPAELSVSNNNAPTSGVLFGFLDTATAGTADVTKLTVSNVDMNNLVVRSNSGDEGIETINLVTTGAQANRIGNLMAQDLVTLTISGSQNLTIEGIEDGNVGQFRSIDGSTATGNLTLSLDSALKTDMEGTSGSGVAVDFSLKTGSGNDTLKVNVATAGNVADTIALGAGTDTVAFTAGDGTTVFSNDTSATFAGVEAITVVSTQSGAAADLTVDLSRLASDTGTDQTIRLTNAGSSDSATFTLNNLTAGEATRITLTHSATDQNGVDETTVVANLADNRGASDKVAVTIVDGVNTDVRFNFALTAVGVENITLTDSDTESNTIRLNRALEHTGIITLTGGVAGQFLNLDHSENVLGKNPAGYGNDGSFINNTATGTNTGALVAADINAEAYAGDVILRVSSTPTAVSATGAQTIRMGTGNDFVVFDNLNDSRAGLTISDTVSGGAGSDTLAIAGNVAVKMGASEWTNVTGFETIRLLGNGVASGPGAPLGTYGYTLSLTDELITRNAADGKLINIVNDGDLGDDGVGARTLSAVTIDARALSVGRNFSYNGEEGTNHTNDRFIFTDAQINSTAMIDGGSARNTTIPGAPNLDVLEVRNAAVISVGDLTNIRNVGIIELTNDTAAHQNVTVELNDAVVDAMVNSYHSATAAEAERLAIRAYDNSLIAAATSSTRLEAGALTSRSAVDVLLGRGVNTVTTGAGEDRVVLLGNYNSGVYPAGAEFGQSINALANSVAGPRIVTDVINLAGGNDTLATYGVLNIAGATLTGIETIEGHSAIAMTAAQLNALTSLNFVGAIPHELFVVFEAGGPTTVDFSKITVEAGGTLLFNLGAGLTSTGTGTGNFVLQTGLTAANIGSFNVIHLSAGGSFTGNAGVPDIFQGTIASLNGTTVTGDAADQDTLLLTDATGTVTLGDGGTGGTITNMHTVILANGTNNVTLHGSTGVKSVIGGEGDDSLVVVNLGDSFVTGGTVSLGDGSDSLTLAGKTYTGTLDGGAGTDTLIVNNAGNISGATVSGFETLKLPSGASVTLTPVQYNQFTSFSTMGIATLKFSGSASPLTLNSSVQTYDFTSVTQNLSITTNATAYSTTSVQAGAGDDYITVVDSSRGKMTLDLSAGGSDRIEIQNTAFNAGAVDEVVITGFNSGTGPGADRIEWGGTAANWIAINAAAQDVTDINNKFLAIDSGIGTFASGFASVIASAVQFTGNYISGQPTFFALIYGDGNAHLVQARLAALDYTSSDVLDGNVTVEHLATLNGITADSLVSGNFL